MHDQSRLDCSPPGSSVHSYFQARIMLLVINLVDCLGRVTGIAGSCIRNVIIRIWKQQLRLEETTGLAIRQFSLGGFELCSSGNNGGENKVRVSLCQ